MNKFIMVTDYYNHWDNIPENQTSYPTFMCRPNNIVEQFNEDYTAKAVFIKINKSEHISGVNIENIWTGEFRIINKTNSYIHLSIQHLVKNNSLVEQYSNYKKSGVYLDQNGEPVQQLNNRFAPPFFDELVSINEWNVFEDLTCYLLKLIGINDIYKIPHDNQAGKPDGYFIIGNLAVIYDCTLKNNFMQDKESQINNYISELKKNPLKYNKNVEHDISKCEKRVWIITRGKSRIIKKHENIITEEIPIDKLIEIYQERLENNYDEKKLVERLLNIINK